MSLEGRWDLIVDTLGEGFPSWLELAPDGGRFVGKVGSARPLESIRFDDTSIEFSLPPQYERRDTPLAFTGKFADGELIGETTLDDGHPTLWKATRAPELPWYEARWGEPVELVGSDLSRWTPRSPEWDNNWSIEGEGLVNAAVGSDLITIDKFTDFKLVAEYRYPKGSNSGIYLRGRYEFQIVDDYEGGPHGVGNSGAIYGFLAPSENAIRPPDEWNTAEIVLVGRTVTVTINGVTVIDRQEIPGITGGALDSDEGAPGPIFVQGDHGPVTYRRLSLYPAI